MALAPALDDVQIEHLATAAAECGDTETEELCDECLDDPEMSWILLPVIECKYHDWMALGALRGWESR